MRIILYIGILFSTTFCSRHAAELRTGDLLFQAGKNSEMTGAITAATGEDRPSDFSHVGIVVASGGADSVLEASTEGGVKMTALEDFLARAARIDACPAVVAMRLSDTSGVAASVARARKQIGQPYDYVYMPDNGKLYCSELVYDSYRRMDGSHIFTARPMNFRAPDGSMPSFWTALFAELGMPVPEGMPGTNPNDMAQERQLKKTGHRF